MDPESLRSSTYKTRTLPYFFTPITVSSPQLHYEMLRVDVDWRLK
jgi:hypothetical protein